MSNEVDGNPPPENKEVTRHPDSAGVEAALIRAGQRARETARQFGMGILIQKDGRIVELMYDGEIREYPPISNQDRS